MKSSQMPNQDMPQDILEFFNQWPNLRNHVINLESGSNLTSDQIAIIHWMILTIDRVGPEDFNRERS